MHSARLRFLPPPGRCCLFFTLLAILLAAVPVSGAEFSAEMWLKEGEKTILGRLYVQNSKMRQEFLDDDGHTVTIIRPDKKVMWVVLPDKRLYMEMPLPRRLPGQFLQIPPDAATKRKVGTDMVNGYPADRYEVTLLGGRRGGARQTYWLAEKLGMPIKMVWHDRQMTLEYRAIKEVKVADRLFEIPPGFQKQTEPSGEPLKRWE
jgi:hypothetical protein